MKVVRFFGKVIFIFVLGGLGGVVASEFVLPWLAGQQFAKDIPWLRERSGGVTVVQPKEEIIIDRADALRVAVAQVRPTIVAVERHEKGTGELLASASGVILTQDGFVATDAKAVSASGTLVVVRGEERLAATLAKIDSENGIALVKVEARGLHIPNFGNTSVLEAGDTVFGMRGHRVPPDSFFVAEILAGYVVYTRAGGPEYSFSLSEDTRGMPVFNSKGEVVGIARSGTQSGGSDEVTSVSSVRELLAR